ncbi:alginate lyase family protein [uncultured Kriegella sp.]|uniref:alginate lyase family protein n=1 Tax=uncultured Kriegella sp. TaxID=1798910 RepID=UPI0030D6F1DA|tara:strand:+ start:194059 stop:195285 length:1227 start_codon:yes stop_codon:yes gene_type:complete
MKYLLLILFVPNLLFSFDDSGINLKKEKSTVPKGFLVSVKELSDIGHKAHEGIEPYHTNVTLFLGFIDSLMQASLAWPQLSREVIITGRSSQDPVQLSSTGGKLAYGTAIAWHLTGDDKYAVKAKELILNLTETYGYRNEEHKDFQWGAQGILNLARGGTPYIYAADLLEGWEGWTAKNKLKYQIWLRDIMYPKVAWASRTRKNNWGVAGSFAAALLSFYVMDHPDWRLEEVSPFPKKLSPKEAFESHNRYQIGRLKTSADWKMDAKVSLWGILPNGAIPEEIRRGKDSIDGDYLPSDGSGTHYTMTHIEHLTAHAEFLNRLGDSSLYDHVETDGSGSLLQAYIYVINNPTKSHCFTGTRINALYMAYRYYKHPAMLRSLKECGPGNISGQRLALYGRLTHPLDISMN